MRQISRIDFVLYLTCVSFGAASSVHGQQGNRPAARPTQPAAADRVPVQRAAPLEANAPKPANPKAGAAAEIPGTEITPELEKILKRWEEESAKIKTLHGTQSRSEFNHTFKVEKVTQGPFFLETPDKGRIDMLACKLTKSAASKKLDKETQKPYGLETDQPTKWICTGDSILQLNEEEKTYQRVEIPKEQRGSNIVHSPLPFLFGIKAEEAKARFTLKLLKDTDDTALLLVIPRMEQDRQNYKKAAITLDKKRYLPTEVRMLDDSGTEVVYSFDGVAVNTRDFKAKWKGMFGMDTDPYHPSLKGYTVVLPNEPNVAAPIQPPSQNAPRRPTGQSQIVPTSASRPATGTSPK